MKFYDVTDLAVRNLRESVFRNSLTTIGIAVGVASLVAMLSLGIGLQQLASRRLQKSGLFDTIVVTSRRDLRNFREQREDGPPPAESPRWMNRRDRKSSKSQAWSRPILILGSLPSCVSTTNPT